MVPKTVIGPVVVSCWASDQYGAFLLFRILFHSNSTRWSAMIESRFVVVG